MVIIVGFNVIILLTFVLASYRFGELAISKGYEPKRAKMYPVYLGFGAFFLNTLGQTLLSFTSKSVMALLFCCWSMFISLILIVILRRAYGNMKTAPDAKSKPPTAI